MTVREVGKFGGHWPVVDVLVEDERAFAAFLVLVPDMWRDLVRAHGGEPIGEPHVEQTGNTGYGWVIGTDDDGEPVIDHVKVFVRVWGRALRPI